MEINKIEAVIESLLFASGDVLALDKIAEILEMEKAAAKDTIDKISERYNNTCRGIMIREINGGYQLCTRQEYYEYIVKLSEPRQKQGLSPAAFETLSIIAYNQPITKAKIESIRGVNSDSAVTKLIERNLVKEAGRLDAPGKPILYKTTDEFLRSFGFKSIADLPNLNSD